MKLVPAVLAIAAGTAAQALGLALAADAHPSWPTVVVLLLAGIVVAGFPLLRGSAPLQRAAPSLFNLRARLGFSLSDASVVLAFGIFLPALGLLGLGIAMVMRSRSGPRRKSGGIIETDAPRLSGAPLQTDQAGRFGPGSLEGILRHSPNPDLRLRVVPAGSCPGGWRCRFCAWPCAIGWTTCAFWPTPCWTARSATSRARSPAPWPARESRIR
jgi:hypothetical protein